MTPGADTGVLVSGGGSPLRVSQIESGLGFAVNPCSPPSGPHSQTVLRIGAPLVNLLRPIRTNEERLNPVHRYSPEQSHSQDETAYRGDQLTARSPEIVHQQ